jgi:hypothetical protein
MHLPKENEGAKETNWTENKRRGWVEDLKCLNVKDRVKRKTNK